MMRNVHSIWLALAVSLDACSSSPEQTEPTEVDPGRPASEYGHKCAVEVAEVATSTKMTFEDCTVSATSSDRTSHVYFDFRRLPQGAERLYMSLVLGTSPLVPSVHASARAGGLEAILAGGRTFAVPDIK